jgi:hypothetical protein
MTRRTGVSILNAKLRCDRIRARGDNDTTRSIIAKVSMDQVNWDARFPPDLFVNRLF